jgi:hypothetical protein
MTLEQAEQVAQVMRQDEGIERQVVRDQRPEGRA